MSARALVGAAVVPRVVRGPLPACTVAGSAVRPRNPIRVAAESVKHPDLEIGLTTPLTVVAVRIVHPEPVDLPVHQLVVTAANLLPRHVAR